MKRVVAYIEILRPVNALIAFSAILTAGLIAGNAHGVGVLLLAAVGGTFIGVSGNIFNDLIDTRIDAVNRPARVLVSGRMGKTEAMIWGIVCTAAGLAASWMTSIVHGLIAAGSVVMIYLYNAHLKKIPLLGNMVVSAVTGAAFLFGALAGGDLPAGIVPAILSLLLILAREIVKDVEDVEGDRLEGIVTIPIRWGVAPALAAVRGILAAVVIGSLVPFALHMYNVVYLVIMLIGVDSLLLFAIRSTVNDPSVPSMRRISTLLKVSMVAGLAAVLAGSW